MRVSIDHGEFVKGLVIKKRWPSVTVKVEFSEEEKAIIKQRKLEKIVVMERDWPAHMGTMSGDFNLTIGGLLKNQLTEYTCDNISRAKQYEAELIERLKRLKEFLGENGDKAESKTFEL
jgi:hypothetical protein